MDCNEKNLKNVTFLTQGIVYEGFPGKGGSSILNSCGLPLRDHNHSNFDEEKELTHFLYEWRLIGRNIIEKPLTYYYLCTWKLSIATQRANMAWILKKYQKTVHLKKLNKKIKHCLINNLILMWQESAISGTLLLSESNQTKKFFHGLDWHCMMKMSAIEFPY